MTEFIAIDGEAVSDGRYVLMRDSTGRKLINENGLKTGQIFQWLLDLDTGKDARSKEYVCFGLNYDANQWLASLTPGLLRRLLDEETIQLWNKYQVTWIPAKAFELKNLDTKQKIKVCEVFGFFQSSFVNALTKWGFEAPSRMKAMKGDRDIFTLHDIPKMLDYCVEECVYLQHLMERLSEACEKAGCVPAHNWWIGAGSVANALLRANGVKQFLVHDTNMAEREIVENYILSAYFGGRVELLSMGVFPNVQTRDIRSAYPFAATFLPNLAAGELIQLNRRQARSLCNTVGSTEHGICRVQWHNQSHRQLAPFPTRASAGAIVYPQSGSGAYHICEIQNAIRLGYEIDVLDGIMLKPADETLPFQFLKKVYQKRLKMKREGDAAEKALKLGINSVYGKLAQGYGRVSPTGHVFPPPYQSYLWAGEITARTRARALAIAHRATDPVMIATDGIFARSHTLKGNASGALGTLETGEFAGMFCGLAGVYSGTKDGKVVKKSRGFVAKEVNYDKLKDLWQTDGIDGIYKYNSRRFIGARVALARNKPELWRQWVTEQRKISLHPDPWRKQWDESTEHESFLKLYPVNRHIDSLPYVPKTALYDMSADIDPIEAMIGDDQPDWSYGDDF